MAERQTVQILKLDNDAIRALNRLSRAIEHSNQLKIELGRMEHKETIDEQLRREAGQNIDEKIMGNEEG